METDNKFKKPLIWLFALIIIGLCIIGLLALKRYWFLPITVLLVTSLLSFLLYKTVDTFKSPRDVDALSLITFVVSAICALMILMGNHKDRATLTGWFVDGQVSKRTFYKEADEGPRGNYETEYVLKPYNESNDIYVDAIDWIIILICFSVMAQTFYLYAKVLEKIRVQKFMKKYPNFKGEIPADFK